ncbi:hypothetical protein EPI10_015901 [Gossypium australe]|uniref:Uncharacterized protein n=1 Tax=Gossypium australe TaxID=47621 RepID=A0A5B6VM33_9ROSI|nr:hypothetical protein EPI10_015901 [Gossypium australe]
MRAGDTKNFSLGSEGELLVMGRLYFPNEEDLRSSLETILPSSRKCKNVSKYEEFILVTGNEK